jgi:cell wall-associated NlpC family hydrolase
MRAWIPRVRVLAAGAVLGLTLVAAAASASNGAQTPRVTLRLVPFTDKDCPEPKVVIGAACVNRAGMVVADKWTLADRHVEWAPSGWRTTYDWTIPETIPPAGAPFTMRLTAEEKTGNPSARICPAIGLRSGIEARSGAAVLPVPVVVGICAESGKTANGSTAVTLIPPTSASTTPLYAEVAAQDGPGYLYRYVAAKTGPLTRTAKAKAAVAWARGQLGSEAWAGKCEAFVERAYGVPPGRGFRSALAASKALDLHTSPLAEAPAGAVLYFDPSRNCTAARPGYGHAGLSLGGGKMISALGRVTVTDAARTATWRNAYIGWAYPPTAWPGRKQ